MSNPPETPGYVLGHSNRELERLQTQARLIDPITRRFFHAAGIARGMRVLDIGSGAGDVAFLAAEMVGADGAVIGIDRVPAALELARARAGHRSLCNVEFRDGLGELRFERPFDAVIGRYVLQFQEDPAAMLRSLVRYVRPGGLVVFHEIDWGGGVASYPAAPTYDRCGQWGAETLRRHGTETRMGMRLHWAFVGAGLPSPSLRLEALVGGGDNSRALLLLMAELMATLQPQMERLGVATAAELGVDGLLERMQAEVIANSSVITGHYQIGAWCRIEAALA